MPVIRFARRMFGNRRAGAALEFVAMAPLLGTMALAVVDLGDVLYTRFRLAAATAAGANYVLAKATDVSTASAHDLAVNAATIVANTTASGWADSVIDVNNGLTATSTAGAVSASDPSDTDPGNAACYCPSGSGFAWGARVTCGSDCTGGGIGGRFVRITAKKAFTPVLSTFGLVSDGYVTVTTAVQTE